jgi:hypothetical protein
MLVDNARFDQVTDSFQGRQFGFLSDQALYSFGKFLIGHHWPSRLHMHRYPICSRYLHYLAS